MSPLGRLRGMARRGRASRRGIALIEIVVAMAVLAVAVLGLMSSLYSSDRLRQSTREQAVAYNAARKVVEQMRNTAFNQIFTSYRPGGSPGSALSYDAVFGSTAVKELRPVTGVPFCEVAFPGTGSPQNLNETVADANWQMPRDLNGDADAVDTNVTATYKLLPVRVTVRWETGKGQSQIVFHTLIVEK